MAATVLTATMPAATPERSAVQAAENLDDIAASSCSAVLQWRKERLHAHQADAQKALQELRRGRASLEDLKELVVTTEDLADQSEQLQKASLRVQQVVQMSTKAAAARCAIGHEVKTRLQQAHAARSQELEAAETTLSRQRSMAESRDEEITTFFDLYKEKLGLSIERAGPAVLKVSFSLLDDEHSDRHGSFKLGMADAKTYCVTECRPAVPAAYLTRLVERLNRDSADASALPAFCCSMRRAFKRIMNKAGAAGGA
eukprot:TRINITY_DN43972_c0_g1_i1.p1 TRINITY_DN43972_c0_g1~~TRINITY_DN43972_c0_g1_i1.p1  ORF type:complete len:257 (-),score=81.92 TRINITY_DN43972_c0_g1_i1:224-994(-)